MRIKKPDMINRILYASSIGVLLIALGFVVWMFTLLFFPSTNLEIKDVEINGTRTSNGHVEHGHLIQGEGINVRTEICKLTDFPVEASVELFDGEKDNVILAQGKTFTDKGCHHIILSAIIPASAPTGDYSVRVTASQNINYLRVEGDKLEIPGFMVVDESHE